MRKRAAKSWWLRTKLRKQISWSARTAKLQSAIDELQVHFREILLLCDVEEMSYQEIAETLSIPIGTVMSRLSRARKAYATGERKKTPAPAMSRGRSVLCDAWQIKLDTYLDGELPSAEMNAFEAHVRECPSCTATVFPRANEAGSSNGGEAICPECRV